MDDYQATLTWQRPLFDAGASPAPPAGRIDTSRDAAASIAAITSTLRTRILRAIHRAGTEGMTADEVECQLQMRTTTTSARIVELRELEMIARSGHKRPTRSGRLAHVYRVTGLGRMALQNLLEEVCVEQR